MRKSIYSIFVSLLVLLLVGCSGDFRPKATGPRNKITVVMDSSMWQSSTADAIRQTFGRYVLTVPRPYHLFDLSFRDFSTQSQLENIQRINNFIIAAPIDADGSVATYLHSLLGDSVRTAVRKGQYFHFLLRNQWYRDQWTLLLTSTGDSVLAQKIKRSKKSFVKPLLELTFKRYQQLIYSTGEQSEVENKIWSEHGWNIRVPLNWKLHIDTTYNQKNGAHTGFLTLQNKTGGNQRWFWAWWTNKPPSDTLMNPAWIKQTQDSLFKKYFQGEFGPSYHFTIEKKHVPVVTDTLKINDYQAYETRGAWRMTNGAMGGPFVNMMVEDPKNHRLFLLGFAQFAPKIRNKRRYVRRFRSILRTFQSDSAWDQRKGEQGK